MKRQEEEEDEDEGLEEFDEHEFNKAIDNVNVEHTERYVDDSLPGEPRGTAMHRITTRSANVTL